MISLRRAIQHKVHDIVGFGSGEIDLDRPVGDPGLFGPGSMPWRVHADFTTMMIGGIRSLLLQMLHPGALAGVWDHSNFREDMTGRLRRTAQFISGTTYGSTHEAERLIDRVRSIHDHVRGTLPDGTPYSANDPTLLTWVHVAEVDSFLAAYLRYRDPMLPIAAQDLYFKQMGLIAERLGAPDVPTSRAAIDHYLKSMRPMLHADERTREVATALMAQPAEAGVTDPFRRLGMQAGVDLLPAWAARMHGMAIATAQRHALRAGVRGIGSVLRWAMRDGSARRAARRMAV